MLYQFSAAQFPYITAAALSLILLFYLLARKQPRLNWPGTEWPLVVMLIAASLWAVAAAFQSSSLQEPVRDFWWHASMTCLFWIPPAWYFFILEFTGRKPKAHKAALFSLFPLGFSIWIWTHAPHNSMWSLPNAEALRQDPVALTCLWISLANLLFQYSLILTSMLYLLRMAYESRGQALAQAILLICCTLIPWLGHLAFMHETSMSFDIMPYLFNLVAAFFVLALLRYRLLNIAPIGYEHIITGMRDGVLVLSPEGRVTHANPSAEIILGQPARKLVGLPIKQALARHPILLENCCKDEAITEIQIGDFPRYYELQISLLRDRSGNHLGRLVVLRNITKRVQAETSSLQNQYLLKQSEDKYRSLIENINDVIFTINTEGIITYISPVVERYTGYSPEALIGKPFRSYIYPDDYESLKVNMGHALKGQVETLEFRILDCNNNIRYARANNRLIIQDDQPVGLQGVITDITDRRLVETALERRASQLTLLNDIGEQIAAVIELNKVLDSATHLLQTSFGYYHVAIYTPDYERAELRMRSASGRFAELFPHDHRLKSGQGIVGWTANNKNILLADDVRLEPRYANLYPDKILARSELAVPILVGDKLLGVLDVQSPQVNAFDDNDVRVIKTVADQIAIAMENARLYDEVRRQLKERERNENMLRIQRDLLFRLSPAKHLDETLQGAVEFLSTELNSSRVSILLVNWEEQTIQPIASRGSLPGQTEHPRPLDGSIFGWAAHHLQPVLIPDTRAHPLASGLCADCRTLLCVPLITNRQVTGMIHLESDLAHAFSNDDLHLVTTLADSLVMLIERARLFEEVEAARAELEKRAAELEEANASLRELDRLKSQFLANVSHELRTPLNSIIGFSEVLYDQLTGPLNDEQMEFVQDILDSGMHLLKLINDLLDFSKLEAGRLALEPSMFPVQSLFNELRSTISPLAEKKSQALVFQPDDGLPLLTADRLRIKQVFINLLSNANKFTPEGGAIFATCCQAEPGWLIFAIRDTGIGIRPEDQELIFEEFRQVDGSLTREVPGTGLGLSISRRIIELHRGKMWVESELGKGSTFFIRIPVDCSTFVTPELADEKNTSLSCLNEPNPMI